jgi:hypothetical protein
VWTCLNAPLAAPSAVATDLSIAVERASQAPFRDHHACSVQATSRVQNDVGGGIIFFPHSRVRTLTAGHIEPPRGHAVRLSARATPAEILLTGPGAAADHAVDAVAYLIHDLVDDGIEDQKVH